MFGGFSTSYRSKCAHARAGNALATVLALKAHCACVESTPCFQLEQARRIEVTSRALCSSKSSIRKSASRLCREE